MYVENPILRVVLSFMLLIGAWCIVDGRRGKKVKMLDFIGFLGCCLTFTMLFLNLI